jgi:hypothetical protein
MVKKIRVIEDETPQNEDPETVLLELGKSMDWKLWELLQIMQRLEKKLNTLALSDVVDEDDTPKSKK